MVTTIAVLTFSLLSAKAGPSVTLGTLLGEMLDPDRLAQVPEPRYKQLQASSYDRTQTDPKDSKTWFGNADWGGYIRKEQRNGQAEWVMMEHDGPGAITRFWIPLLAERENAIIRFTFDGAEKPAIEVKYNDLLRGKGLFKPPFAFISWPNPAPNTGVAGDLYFPIPFAKSCKVTLSEDPYYFAIGYRAYARGTNVKTFSSEEYLDMASGIKDFGRVLEMHPRLALVRRVSKRVKNRKWDSWSKTISAVQAQLAPGKSVSLNLPKGNRKVRYLSIKVPKNVASQALRSTIVQLDFDGESTVWCPIGDFFGCGVNLRPVWDRYRKVDADGTLSCYWSMPYRKSASVKIVNLNDRPMKVDVEVDTTPRTWNARTMYFHTTWRHQFPLATRPMSDWNYVMIKGQGLYVGDTLTVMNPVPAWYGEGDERVYVDNESFPSTLGTGTEDYYGYAWGMSSEWSSPLISLPKRDRETRDNWTGFTTTSRVRILDGLWFEKALKFDMEIWHWASCNVEYSVACFWYARPGATSNRKPSPQEAAMPLPDPGNSIKGAVECETMQVVSKSDRAIVEAQSAGLVEGSWSNGTQLYVRNDVVGGFVELRFATNLKGKHHLLLYATRSYDYGIVRLSVNGSIAKEFDLWNDRAVATGPIDLGVFDLTGNPVTLRAEVVGTNPKSTGSHYLFGLDCVVVKPAK